MPSYRVVLSIGALKRGVAPESILPLAASSAREFAVVEAFDLGIVAGRPRITVRFMADDAEIAGQIAQKVASDLAEVAEVPAWNASERVGSRWNVVR